MRSNDHAAPKRCENCGGSLQGRFCARCGQCVINPVRHAGHALEEVFESFWHLDGRVFRTLRDLLVPARVACDYLGGHRARYIAPLRLLVVLSVLTFFVAQVTIQLDQDTVLLRNDAADTSAAQTAIGRATTVAEVERLRDEALRKLAVAKADMSGIPGAGLGMEALMSDVRALALRRIGELPASAAAEPSTVPIPATPATTATTATTPAAAAAASAAPAAGVAKAPAASPAAGVVVSGADGWMLTGDQPWDEHANPLQLPPALAFAQGWFNHQLGKAKGNLPRIKQDPNLYKDAAIGAIPTALFVLVPFFALLLKLAYLRQRRLYLEHLVVALYSHAFLLLSLLAMFVLVGLDRWLAPVAPWTSAVFGLLQAALWIWMPLYLLLMHKRVYAQGWPTTLLKYGLLGGAYFLLVLCATVLVVLVSFVRV